MGKTADEQIKQQFEYIAHLEGMLKLIKKEARESGEGFIEALVDNAFSFKENQS